MVVVSGSGEGGHSAPSFSAQRQQQSPPLPAFSTTPRHCRPPRKNQLSGYARASDTRRLILTSKKKAGVEFQACSWPHRPNDHRQNQGPGPAGPRRPSSSGRAPSHLTFDSPDRPPFFEHLAHHWSQLRAHTNLDPAIPRARVPLLRLLVPSLLAVSVFNATLLTHTRHTSGTCDGSSLLSHTPHPLSSTPHPPSTGLTPPAHSSCQHTFPSPSPPPW